MRKDKLSNLNAKRTEGVFKIKNNKFVVRFKVRQQISSIKIFDNEPEAQQFYDDCKSGKIIPNTKF